MKNHPAGKFSTKKIICAQANDFNTDQTTEAFRDFPVYRRDKLFSLSNFPYSWSWVSLLLLIISFNSYAATIIWPGVSAPCNGTLQFCVNTSNDGDIVEIHSNGPINENIQTNLSVSIIAGTGFKPVFAAGNRLQIHTNSGGVARTIRVEGLTFEQGGINLTTLGDPITFYIENNIVLDNLPDTPAIRVNTYGTGSFNAVANVNFNQVSVDSASSTLFPLTAIIVSKNGTGSGTLSGQVFNNVVTAAGENAVGIYALTSSSADFSFNITGNEIYGANFAGIYSRRSGSAGLSDLDISSNALYPGSFTTSSAGIYVQGYAGTTNVDIINNTMINGRYGVLLTDGGTGSTINAQVHSNIVAYADVGFNFESGASVNNDYNLYYQNATNYNYTPGANSINADPKIISIKNARLKAGSPALENGSPLALIFVSDAPFIDADGLIRIKNATGIGGAGFVDIGAYEAGDITFNHKSTVSGSHISIINNPATNNNPNLDSLHVTSNWNPVAGFPGIYNTDNEGLYYTGGNWRVFNESFVDISLDASFNISRLASTSNTFEHTVTTSGNNNSTINNSGLDGNPDMTLQLTQHWTGVYNPNPPGVFYLGGKWMIINMSLAIMPLNANFNIYYQTKSKSAYEHIARVGNIVGNYTVLDNPLINGVSCAQIQVTQSASQSVFNSSPIGVFYHTSLNQWAIFNQNIIATMPQNAAFHILINPAQIADCTRTSLFKDSFE